MKIKTKLFGELDITTGEDFDLGSTKLVLNKRPAFCTLSMADEFTVNEEAVKKAAVLLDYWINLKSTTWAHAGHSIKISGS